MSSEPRVGGRRWSASALIFAVISLAAACVIAAIVLLAILVGARLDSGSNVSAALWSGAVGAAGVAAVAMAAAAFALRAAIAAPLAALAGAFEVGAEPGTSFHLADAVRLAAGAHRLAAIARSRERKAVAEREAQWRAELAVAEQAAARAESRLLGLAHLSDALAALARGDLTVRMSDAPQAHPSAARLDQTVELFTKTMLAFSASLDAIRRGAAEMNASVGAYGDEVSKLTARAESTLHAFAKQTDRAADEAAPLSASASLLKTLIGEASDGAVQVQQGGRSLDEIRQTARQIEPILTLVDEVAFQTHLLALNAAVEAARVGDAGKGFAVVAQELRLLSQRAKEAAKQSSGLLCRVLAEAERGAGALAEAVPAAFAERAAKVIGVLEQTGGQWADRRGAGDAARTLTESIAEATAARTLLNDAMLEETESLEGLLGKLSALIDRFRLPADADAPFRAPPRPMSASADSQPRRLPSPAPGRLRRS